MVIKLDLKPVSVNKAYYGRNRKFTQEARQYRASFLSQLQTKENLEVIREFKSLFNKLSMVSVHYRLFVPSQYFRTKEGAISIKSFDLTNWEKIVQDLLTDTKYNASWYSALPPREHTYFPSAIKDIENLAFNDKFITELKSSKEESYDNDWHLEISLSLS